MGRWLGGRIPVCSVEGGDLRALAVVEGYPECAQLDDHPLLAVVRPERVAVSAVEARVAVLVGLGRDYLRDAEGFAGRSAMATAVLHEPAGARAPL